MDNAIVANELRSIVDELDRVRRGLMYDAPRRTTFEWASKAKVNAEELLVKIEQENRTFRDAAE